MARLSCPGCGGSVSLRRRCMCGRAARPVPREAGWRPRIVEEIRSLGPLGTEGRRLFSGAECRATRDTIYGHAAVYGTPSAFLPGGFVEVLEPGAFDLPLYERGNVRCRYNHDDGQVLGDTDSGNLDVWTDGIGLAYSVTPGPRFAWLVDEVREGRITSSSFAFRLGETGRERWGRSEEGWLIRELLDVGTLLDTAPVDDPAYVDADDLALV